MKLEVGKTYVNGLGENVKIVNKYDDKMFPFRGDDGECYTTDGSWSFNDTDPRHLTKEAYPRVMEVSDSKDFRNNATFKRVVFMEKCGKFLAWKDAETLSQAKNEIGITQWRYAREVQPEIKLTIDGKDVELSEETIQSIKNAVG